MKGPKPGGLDPARIIAAVHSAATSASAAPSWIAAMAASVPASEALAAARIRACSSSDFTSRRVWVRVVMSSQSVRPSVATTSRPAAKVRPLELTSNPSLRPFRAASSCARWLAGVTLSPWPEKRALRTWFSIVTRSIARVTRTIPPSAGTIR